MCDPVTCEKCRNVAGCKESEGAQNNSMPPSEGSYWLQWKPAPEVDNTAPQVERLASLKPGPERLVSGQTEAAEHPLSVENRSLKTSIRQLQDQLADLHGTNISLMNSNRHLTQLLRAIQSITEAAP